MLTNLAFAFICVRASSALVRTSAFLQPVVRGQVYIFEISPPLNFNMNVIHSATTKKSLSKSFFGLQPSGFRLSQAETCFDKTVDVGVILCVTLLDSIKISPRNFEEELFYSRQPSERTLVARTYFRKFNEFSLDFFIKGLLSCKKFDCDQ